MKIYIPTLGRPKLQSTLDYLTRGDADVTLVVQNHEAAIYRKYQPRVPLLVLPPEIRTISPTRQWILENAQGRYFAMMDDDLRFGMKNPLDRTKLIEPTDDDLVRMMKMLKETTCDFPHVSISAREGNNRKLNPHYFNERIMRVLAYDKKHVPDYCRFDRIPLKQDFDMTLQMLRAGRMNCVIYEYANDQIRASNAKGGCSKFRTLEMVNQAAKDLQRLHPRFVGLVQKENNNWKGLENRYRTEVVVAWKQAYLATKIRTVL